MASREGLTQTIQRCSRPLVGQFFRHASSGSSSTHSAAIRELREKTGAPIKDVKNTLVECEWDVDAAFTLLRKKGLAAASKKKSRVAADGLLGIARGPYRSVVVEINSETDFVARNDMFQHLVSRVAQSALEVSKVDRAGESEGQADVISLEALQNAPVLLQHPKLPSSSRSVREAVEEVAAITGENVQLRRAFAVAGRSLRDPQENDEKDQQDSSTFVASYLHGSRSSGLSRIAGLVSLRLSPPLPPSSQLPSELEALGEQLAMHIVASRPLFVSDGKIPASVVEHERSILWEQASASGKPPAVIEKMVAGRMRKFFEDTCLLDQKFIMDDSKTVKSLLAASAKSVGHSLSVVSLLRAEVGEGIEREEKDFAAEVAAQAGG